MDEVWFEVLSSSEEEIYSEEENWAEENNGSETENWDEENNSSMNENRAKKYSFEEELKECISAEGNSIEINSSAEENMSEADEPMEEYFVEESCSKEYSSAKENYSKVYSLVEESCSKGYSSAEEYSMDNSPEENSSAEEYSMDNSPEENSSTEKYSMDDSRENNSSEEEYSIYSSPETNRSEEEYWLEQDEPVEKNFIEEHGLIVEADAVNKEIYVVEILVVGNDNCGKTQLIKGAFSDHSSFKDKKYDGRDEYIVYMSKNLRFYIVIRDIMDTEFARKESFSKEAVTFFCYDVNDMKSLVRLEETWIPTFHRENMGSFFLLGIERNPKSKRGSNSQEHMSIHNKAQELCQQLPRARLVHCSTEVKSSMLNVFQSAIDTVYPKALS